MPDLIQLLTTAQVAERLGKTPRTVQRMVAAGVLIPFATLPGKTGAHLFKPDDVERLRESKAS